MIPPGLEPGTSRLGILRSILMSYGTTGVSYNMGVDWGRWGMSIDLHLITNLFISTADLTKSLALRLEVLTQQQIKCNFVSDVSLSIRC